MLKLIPLNRYNWEACADLKVADDQRDYMPDNLFSIAQSRFENSELYGVALEESMIGFLMIGHWSGLHWISRLMIDEEFQGLGYGTEALNKTVEMLRERSDAREIRATVSRKNAVAEYLFVKCGFDRLGLLQDQKEIVLSMRIK